MAQNALKHKFKVQRVSYTANTDVTLNIKKRKDNILYTGQSHSGNVNLAFAQTKAINSVDNLFISDRSTSLAANRIIDLEPDTFTGASFSSEVDTFFLTDIFTEETTTQESKPLFFQHIIGRDIFNPDNSTHAIISMEILDTDFKVLTGLSEILVDVTSVDDLNYGVVFNNLQNVFDEQFSIPIVFYLKYTVRKGSNISSHIELLDNSSVYREATLDDLDEFSNLISTRKVYSIEESGLGDFTVTISRNTLHAVIKKVESRLRIIKPSLRSNNEPWFVSVSNGKFFTTVPNKVNPVKYELAEFETQIFNPYFPYKTVVREEAVDFKSNLFKLAHQNISTDLDQGFEMTVEVQNVDGEVIYAFSSNASKIGTAFNSSVDYTDGLRSIDHLNGFIDIRIQLENDDVVLVSYIYEEKEYEFTEVNFNPVNNKDVINETAVLYVIPQVTELERTLFYLRVDRSGRVIFSSQAEYGDTMGTDIATQMVSSGLLYYNKMSPLITSGISFIDRYTVESESITSDNPMALILGEIYVGEDFSNTDVSLTDIRVRGGGIVEADRKEIIAKNSESLWNWDIGSWDGYPFPGAASYFVEIPCEVLTTNGGNFTKDEARSVIEEHTAAGVYPIIRTYSIDPIVSGVNITTSGVTLKWTDHGPDVGYNLYQATVESGPYTKVNSVLLTDTVYTVSGLDAGTYYWFTVAGVEDSLECLDSDRRFTVQLETI